MRPNILFCLADDAGMHMGAYGCDWVSTPGFDRVARDGILFNHAYTPNSKCAPSRAAILTGRNSWQLESGALHMNYFPAKFKTSFETLRENGYHVGHTLKGWGPGIAEDANGVKRELTGKAYNECKLEPPTGHIADNDYASNFRAFMNDRPADTPFCFWYGSVEPHRGYEYGSGVKLGGRSIKEIDRVPGIWPDNEVVRNDLLDYGFEIEYYDSHIVRMLETLEEAGELDNTLVIVTSDNGMPFPRCKGQEYEYSNHLPMACMWPAGIKNPGRKCDDYVSFIDIAPTLLELAGVDQTESGMQPITGRSLTDVFNSEINPERDHALIGKERHDPGRPDNAGYPIRGIFEDGWLYLRNFEPSFWPHGNPETGYLNCDGSPTKTEILKARKNPETRSFWQFCFGKHAEEELYHTAADPDCMENLADSGAHKERRDSMHSRMEKELKEQEDPRMFGKGDVFDAYPFAGPFCQDYYERYMKRDETGEEMAPGWIYPTDIENVDESGNDR